MKKLISVILTLVLASAFVFPALAESGDEAIFNTKVQRVANDPTVEYDEWDIPYNVWNPLPDTAAINPGDTVTLMLSYQVPATVEGYSDRLSSSIEYITTVNGLDDVTLVEAQGCPGKVECDYDIGICFPVPGEYANVELNGSELKVMAELGSDVKVILRGTATDEFVTGTTAVTIGQYRFPAQFEIGTVDKGEANGFPSYNIHWSDFILVQKRAVEYRVCEGMDEYTTFVAKNNHYHRYDPENNDFIPVNEAFEDVAAPIDHEDPMYEALIDTLNQVNEYFGLESGQTMFTDEDFLGDAEHYTFEYPFEFGGNEEPVEPTEEPVDPEPTEEPVDPEPTDAPADPEPTDVPTDPTVPPTGAISFAFIGIAAALGGCAVIARRKH